MTDQAHDVPPRRLTISLFGQFEARLDGTTLGGFEYNKVRALLAYLAVEHTRAHTRASLCALLWPDLGESAARQNLSQALTRLRQVFGDKHAPTPLLLTTTETVQLNPLAACDVDVNRFQMLMTEVEAHAHRGWHLCTPCARKLRAAVDLYNGDFLAHFYVSDSAEFEEWALPLRMRLRLRMLSALERLVQYAEWRGSYDQAALYAQRLTELEPLRDRSHRELMRLLALSGQQTGALAHYEYLRHTLATELDTEPEPETIALYEQIRAATDIPALRRFQPPPSHLPAAPTPIVGREADVQAICAQLAEGSNPAPVRLLTITGAPGIGKTRLALEVASHLRFDFANGVHVVELAPVLDAAQVPAAVAAVLGIKEQGRQALAAAVREHLRSTHALLVLDNFEHVLDAAPFVGDVLAACPTLTLVITSRIPLHLRTEHQYALQPLSIPAEHAALDVAAQAESVQLFVRRVQAIRPQFALACENVAAITTICRWLDGLPLAIELITPRLKLLSINDILQQWESRLAAATSGLRDVPPRHRTLRNAILWSYERLSGDEQRVFASMGVFKGGCTVEALQAIVGDTILVLSALEALHDASLLYTQPTETGTRFLLLETIGEFALETLAASGDRACAEQRHAAYFVQLADAAYTELLGPHQAQWSARIAVEQDNFRAALRWALDHNAIEIALRIGTGLWRFWWQRGFLREGSQWLALALERRHEAPLAVQTKALRAMGVLAMGLNEYGQACQWLEQALDTARQAGATYDCAAALTNLGLVLREQGDFQAACVYLEQAIALNRSTSEPRAVKFPMIILAELYARVGNMAEAGALYEECLRLNREIGDAEGTANALYGMGLVAHAQADYLSARQWCDESLALYGSLNHQFGLGYCYGLAGNIARDHGTFAEALQHYSRCLAIWMQRENLVSAAFVLDEIAQALLPSGHAERSVRLMGAAAAMRAGADAKLTTVEHAAQERVLAGCRAAIGEAACRKAWLEGRALLPDQAVSLALLNVDEADDVQRIQVFPQPLLIT